MHKVSIPLCCASGGGLQLIVTIEQSLCKGTALRLEGEDGTAINISNIYVQNHCLGMAWIYCTYADGDSLRVGLVGSLTHCNIH